jgi:hypothetical protein
MSQHAQQVQAVGMVRIEVQNLPVDSLRLGQLSALVKLEGIAGHVLKVHKGTRTLVLPPRNKVQGAAHWVSVLT